jgi:membrane carboxypeptidase/penicillin-binding protein
VGVWTGFDEKKTMGAKMTGSFTSLPTWTAVMKTAYADRHAPDFVEPEGIVHRVVCEKSGLIATDSCPRIRREVFIEGTEPQRACDRHGSASSRPLQDLDGIEELDRQLLEN